MHSGRAGWIGAVCTHTKIDRYIRTQSSVVNQKRKVYSMIMMMIMVLLIMCVCVVYVVWLCNMCCSIDACSVCVCVCTVVVVENVVI